MAPKTLYFKQVELSASIQTKHLTQNLSWFVVSSPLRTCSVSPGGHDLKPTRFLALFTWSKTRMAWKFYLIRSGWLDKFCSVIIHHFAFFNSTWFILWTLQKNKPPLGVAHTEKLRGITWKIIQKRNRRETQNVWANIELLKSYCPSRLGGSI